MTASSDDALVDTNVFVYSLSKETPEHEPARLLRERAQNADANLCIAPQVIAEFYSTVTNPKRVRSPFTPSQALAEVDNLLALPGLALLPVPLDVVDRLTELLRRRPVSGAKVYDLQLIAVMLGNGIRCIYTFNIDDFAPFAELEVLTPPAV